MFCFMLIYTKINKLGVDSRYNSLKVNIQSKYNKHQANNYLEACFMSILHFVI